MGAKHIWIVEHKPWDGSRDWEPWERVNWQDRKADAQAAIDRLTHFPTLSSLYKFRPAKYGRAGK